MLWNHKTTYLSHFHWILTLLITLSLSFDSSCHLCFPTFGLMFILCYMLDHNQNVCALLTVLSLASQSMPWKVADKLILLALPCDLWPQPSHPFGWFFFIRGQKFYKTEKANHGFIKWTLLSISQIWKDA